MSEAPIILSKWQRDTFNREQAKSEFAEFIKLLRIREQVDVQDS